VAGQRLAASDEPLALGYDAALCDLDGVLYLGDAQVPHAAESVRAARRNGMQFAFVTNNASRSPKLVAQRLTGLGIPADSDDVVTSGQAAARLVAARLPPGSAVLVLGTDALAAELVARGLRPVRRLGEVDDVVAVVQGLAPETSWSDLAEAAVALRAGALWVVGNRDATLPAARGPLPGNGAFVDVLRTTTGREPVVAGKPEPALHRESVERVGARRPLVVGDRLDTDVLGAVRGGADSLLVLTGVTDVDELLHAPTGCRPTYVARDLRGLLAAHPPVTVDGPTARCAGSGAGYENGVLRRWDDSDDALRALVALGWHCRDAGLPVDRWE
jgi:glycerol 3-phosphatase-2